jgi:hypothetical protein
MLGVYFSSLTIWAVIIYAIVCLARQQLKDNGWAEQKQKKYNWMVVLICVAAVPILRVLVAAGLLFMTTITKEEYQKEHIKDE